MTLSWVRRAGRLGHVSVGSVYVLVGALAMAAAFDPGRDPTDSVGVFRRLLMDPLGGIVAIALVVGLLADTVWQAARAFGGSARGAAAIVQRATWLGSGAIHLGLAIAVMRLVAGARDPDGDTAVKSWSGWILDARHGDWILGVTAAVVLAVALVMVYRAWSGDVDRSLDPSAMSRLARRLAGALARVGLAARAVMLGTVGVFLLLAALHHDAAHAQAIAGTFRGVRYAEYGQAVLGLLALGFIANGLVELLRARFRRQRIDA